MDLFEELKALGVNIDEGLKRLNGNEKLYTRLLGSFIKSVRENAVAVDFDDNDLTVIIDKTHAIKGTSGNMSITPVYKAYTEIVDLLRAGDPEEARKILKGVLPIQEEIIACIEKHMG